MRTPTIFAFIFLAALLLLLGCPSNPCAENPGSCGSGGGDCGGACTPPVPPQTTFHVLLWTGPEGATPPPCPPYASLGQTTGYVDAPPNTVTCEQCTCSVSENTCFPSQDMNAFGSGCPGSGTPMPFAAPQVWDGTCNTDDPVSSASSVTVAAPLLGSQGGCAVGNAGAVEFTGGATIAERCNGVEPQPGVCGNPEQTCTYPSTPGFLTCAYMPGGEFDCPADWPVRHLLYEKETACECACGAPTGEACTATVTAYSDSACMQPVGSTTIVSGAAAPACFNVAAASALGSKSAKVTFTPGMCATQLTPLYVVTVCCLAP